MEGTGRSLQQFADFYIGHSHSIFTLTVSVFLCVKIFFYAWGKRREGHMLGSTRSSPRRDERDRGELKPASERRDNETNSSVTVPVTIARRKRKVQDALEILVPVVTQPEQHAGVPSSSSSSSGFRSACEGATVLLVSMACMIRVLPCHTQPWPLGLASPRELRIISRAGYIQPEWPRSVLLLLYVM